MTQVNLERARQLVNASALAYQFGSAAFTQSPHFAKAALDTGVQPEFIASGIDAAFVATTSFGAVLAFRGTQPPTADLPKVVPVLFDWLNDADIKLIDVKYAAGQVHSGFDESLQALCHAGLIDAVKRVMQGGRRLFITGHSKGGALAALAALLLLRAGVVPSGVITFGAPRAGDEKFALRYDAEVLNHWRFEHQDDVVPHVPPHPSLLFALRLLNSVPALASFLNALNAPIGAYQHVGRLCFLTPDDRLQEDDTQTLRLMRDARLLVAGTELITDHFIDATHLLHGKRGYVETVGNLR